MNKTESNKTHTQIQSNFAVIRDPMYRYTDINYTNFQITLKLITNDRTYQVIVCHLLLLFLLLFGSVTPLS